MEVKGTLFLTAPSMLVALPDCQEGAARGCSCNTVVPEHLLLLVWTGEGWLPWQVVEDLTAAQTGELSLPQAALGREL